MNEEDLSKSKPETSINLLMKHSYLKGEVEAGYILAMVENGELVE